jgi:hypothetical protein
VSTALNVAVSSGNERGLLGLVFSRDGKRLATANAGYFETGQSVILW